MFWSDRPLSGVSSTVFVAWEISRRLAFDSSASSNEGVLSSAIARSASFSARSCRSTSARLSLLRERADRVLPLSETKLEPTLELEPTLGLDSEATPARGERSPLLGLDSFDCFGGVGALRVGNVGEPAGGVANAGSVGGIVSVATRTRAAVGFKEAGIFWGYSGSRALSELVTSGSDSVLRRASPLI